MEVLSCGTSTAGAWVEHPKERKKNLQAKSLRHKCLDLLSQTLDHNISSSQCATWFDYRWQSVFSLPFLYVSDITIK